MLVMAGQLAACSHTNKIRRLQPVMGFDIQGWETSKRNLQELSPRQHFMFMAHIFTLLAIIARNDY